MILNNVRAKDKARQGNMLIEKLLENDFLIKITYFFICYWKENRM